jgi:uncharacterized protein (TIGR03437 family)
LRTSLIGITISCSLFALAAQAQTPTITSSSVINAASRVAGPIAPGMVADITGSNLGTPSFPISCASGNPIPTNCDGVSVLVNGVPAPVIFDSATVISFQVPFNIGGSTATIQVTSSQSGSTLSSAVVTVPVAATAPGVFTTNGTGSGTAYYSDAITLLSEVSPPVQAGDTVVLFATGFGVTSPAVASGVLGPNSAAAAVASVTMTINNQSVPVTFAGLEPGNLNGANVGYDEVVFTVPSGLTVPAGQASAGFPMVVTVGGVASESVNLLVATPLPSITSISPNPVPLSASPQTVLINGSGFQNGASVRLENPSLTSITIPASSVTFISASQLSFQITTGTTAGTWGLLVLNPDGGNSSTFQFTASGTGPTSTITSIVTTSSNAPQIAQNTWIEVHGTNLSQVTTTWTSYILANGVLPTALGGVSATVDGKAAVIYYVSPTQINVLAPLDSAIGTVPVQLTTPYGQTSIQTATELTTSPAFLVIDPPAGHVAAQHSADYSLLGPPSLDAPGYTFTPAKAGELVVLYATGFGQTNPPITSQLTGTGPLPTPWPTVTIGSVPAVVAFAGLTAPGLYQFNVTVPAGLPSGDATLLATYNNNGSSTQSKVFLTIQ